MDKIWHVFEKLYPNEFQNLNIFSNTEGFFEIAWWALKNQSKSFQKFWKKLRKVLKNQEKKVLKN